jgi:hypothetical protein
MREAISDASLGHFPTEGGLGTSVRYVGVSGMAYAHRVIDM